MGTEISLDIAGLSIAWTKNNAGIDHGFLFQPCDLKRFQDDDSDPSDDPEDAVRDRGFSRSLAATLLRLELLGHTLRSAEAEYERAAATTIEERKSYQEYSEEEVSLSIMSFAEFQHFIKAITIAELDNTFASSLRDEEHFGRFGDEDLKKRIPFYPNVDSSSWSERSYFGTLVGFLDPYTLLRLLAENEANLIARLDWQYGPLVYAGWAKEAEFVPGVRRQQTYLIATEGSSDTHILKRAFQLLRPEIADFFRFIDVSERHPFSGTGSLVKFAEGLAKIDVQNRTVFLFDNDTEGRSAFKKIQELTLPINMRSMVLPDLEEFNSFPCVGPSGQTMADINGRAASIECYLDLNTSGITSPEIRWTNYKDDMESYQGALQDKERFSKAFFDNIGRGGAYDTSKLSRVLDAIIGVSTVMAEDMRMDMPSRSIAR